MDANGELKQKIVEEMEESYLDYAMSVIVARALPDVRDGLKPVHRRILFAMWNLGLRSGGKFRKSATVVGEVLGKYHPHGDTAVYDSMVRMAQDFAMRYPLVNGQGNFGSMDGDRAAAMRYTEAKLEKIADELLFDIDKDTVNFAPNYDGTHDEPIVLPAKLPNLLLNGTVGIAVGMATNIPPHNLGELCDGIAHLLEHPQTPVEDLLEFVKGPDFPTGGQIFNIQDIKQAYATGKGPITMRGKAEIMEEKSGQFRIIITEVPYQVNKATMIEKIANLVKDKKIEGIRDLRDESDKDGVRVVVELKKDAYPKKVLNRLYSLTQLQENFNVNMLALVDGIQPRVLNLKMVLEEFIKHRKEVITRRTKYELKKAEERAHILEGLVMALEKIDAIIKTIKQSKDKEQAKANLIKKFKLSDRQAVAILEMKLQQLANLERLKVEEELKEIKKLVKELKGILQDEKKVQQIIKEDLQHVKESYGDERRTQIFPHAVGKFSQKDLIPKEDTIVMITQDGYIKRVPPSTFKAQSRGGKGVIGLSAKEEDSVGQMMTTTTHAELLFFTTRGRVFQLKAYEVPQASRTAKGQAIVNFLQLSPEEKVSNVLSVKDLSNSKFLVMVTEKGIIKKTDITSFDNLRRSGLIAIKLKDGDNLEWIKPSTGDDEIMLVSGTGQAIRFKEKDIRAMGRSAAGVRGIRLKGEGKIVGMGIIKAGKVTPEDQILVIMGNGYGKRTELTKYKTQNRGGTGIKTAKITDKTGKIKAAFIVNKKREQEDLIIISDKGQVIRLALKSVNVLGRDTQGVRLMRFKEKEDKVASVTFVDTQKEEDAKPKK
ncbi:DNA gyrase subunit A [Patescibacteria group bacterium]|nr:DNA gyrase subunit A [Patescibacteria group bacterium]MBU1673179.1 DNA gyrase subunit A [Patescibacteria group bacterium]MBU1963041.1 DNA gyrase subunit A [Patescibacteria group bacterium]